MNVCDCFDIDGSWFFQLQFSVCASVCVLVCVCHCERLGPDRQCTLREILCSGLRSDTYFFVVVLSAVRQFRFFISRHLLNCELEIEIFFSTHSCARNSYWSSERRSIEMRFFNAPAKYDSFFSYRLELFFLHGSAIWQLSRAWRIPYANKSKPIFHLFNLLAVHTYTRSGSLHSRSQ